MKRQIIDIKKLVPNPDNPRIIKDEAFKKLVASVKQFPEMLEAREIVVNEDMVILGGNMRYRACLEAGIKEVPVKIVNWSEDRQREFVIKDNVSGGDWDWDILANEWDIEELGEWGLDTSAFSEDEEPEEPKITEDDAPELTDTAESELGKIYQLGRHRIICGDSTNPDDIKALMGGGGG